MVASKPPLLFCEGRRNSLPGQLDIAVHLAITGLGQCAYNAILGLRASEGDLGVYTLDFPLR